MESHIWKILSFFQKMPFLMIFLVCMQQCLEFCIYWKAFIIRRRKWGSQWIIRSSAFQRKWNSKIKQNRRSFLTRNFERQHIISYVPSTLPPSVSITLKLSSRLNSEPTWSYFANPIFLLSRNIQIYGPFPRKTCSLQMEWWSAPAWGENKDNKQMMKYNESAGKRVK